MAREVTEPSGHSLSGLTVPALLGLEASIVEEWRRRGLVRSNNKPLGDIAEQVVLAARGGVLEPNSTKSHDITTPAGLRIQVKAMGARTVTSGTFSPFRSFDFDTAVFLVFAAGAFDLALAREVTSAEVEAVSAYSKHTNGKQPTLAQVRGVGVDVTAEMQVERGAGHLALARHPPGPVLAGIAPVSDDRGGRRGP